MTVRRYHKDVGFPSNFQRPTRRVELRYSRHAAEQATKRGVPRLKSVTLGRFEVVEITVERGTVTKYFVRGTLDSGNDLLLSLAVSATGPWTVCTTWVNSKSDHHSTLDTTVYERP